MGKEINKVKKAIGNFTANKIHKQVGIVIYRDHDCKDCVDVFPKKGQFTSDMKSVIDFL